MDISTSFSLGQILESCRQVGNNQYSLTNLKGVVINKGLLGLKHSKYMHSGD